MTEHFPKLNLPQTSLRIETENGVLKVRCLVRKKMIVLTPEEWIRQQFIGYLNTSLHYPLSLMKVEKQIQVNDMNKRFDIVCVTNTGQMKLLVECKSMNVKLNAAVFDQAARYNQSLAVPYLCITNGLEHFCAFVKSEDGSVSYLENIPNYNQVKSYFCVANFLFNTKVDGIKRLTINFR